MHKGGVALNSEDTKVVTGACRFCGQIMAVEKSEAEWLDLIRETNKDAEQLADEEATRQCRCYEGTAYRKETAILKEAEVNIEMMFRDNLPEIADTFQAVKEFVQQNKIKKISISTHENGTASMVRREGNIKIDYRETKKTELTTTG